ncbi:MAG: ABC transporter permease [Spirochaetaceae bacterium]|jgi:peptide/nickel transport system permease protein|nr:ABC transporter permease [Spirochaetaceae bacterium]
MNRHSSPLSDALERFSKNRLAVASCFVILVYLFCALFPQAVAPYGYDDQNLQEMFLSPSREHPCGTDNLGRDIFSRMVWGSRISLTIGILSVAISLSAGLVLGCLAGYCGERIDNLIMRLMDVFMAIPSVLLAIAVVASLGIGFKNMVIAISLAPIPQYARLIRGAVLSVKYKDFVTASYADGAGGLWVIRRHILPNCLAPIIVQATTNIAVAILTASSLSFIGLGIVPPTPEWGAMLSAGRAYFRDHWFVVTFPGLAIMFAVLAFNLFGDGLRDALDPKMRR